MGARFTEPAERDGLPLTIRGGRLAPLRYELPVSSAQIKSALLLAGLAGGVEVAIREPHGRSRDHTERMLRAFGFRRGRAGRLDRVRADRTARAVLDAGARAIRRRPPFSWARRRWPKAATLRIAGVGLNPTRDRLSRRSASAWADGRRVERVELRYGEPVGDLVVRAGRRSRAPRWRAGEIPGLIDEIPMLAVLASRASGTTAFRAGGRAAGQGERPAQPDRRQPARRRRPGRGVAATICSSKAATSLPRGRVRTAGDHRLAMAFAVLGTLPGARVSVDDMACAAVSFPGFSATLRAPSGGDGA